MNARGLDREVPSIVFFTVANHGSFGIALQDYRLSTTPARPQEGVVWAFEVAASDLSVATDAAKKQKLCCERVDYSTTSPVQSSLFIVDPDGNRWNCASEETRLESHPKARLCRSAASAMYASK